MVPPARSDGGFFHVSSKFELAAIALATIGVFVVAQASAQSPAIEPAPLEAQAGRTATFDIPSQPLAQALTAFGQQAGLQIAVNAAAVSGKTSIAVSGAMTAEQALQRLLAGTGVSYRFTSPNAVTVSGGPDTGSAVHLDPVRVQANAPPPQAEIGNPLPVYAGGNVARGGRVGELGNRDYMDTPFSTTTYTEKYIERNQARTLVDAVNRRSDDPAALRPGRLRRPHADPRLPARHRRHVLQRPVRRDADLQRRSGRHRPHRGVPWALGDAERHGAQRGDRRHDQLRAQARHRRADHPALRRAMPATASSAATSTSAAASGRTTARACASMRRS